MIDTDARYAAKNDLATTMVLGIAMLMAVGMKSDPCNRGRPVAREGPHESVGIKP